MKIVASCMQIMEKIVEITAAQIRIYILINFALLDAMKHFHPPFETESQWPHMLLSKRLPANDNETFPIKTKLAIFLMADKRW